MRATPALFLAAAALAAAGCSSEATLEKSHIVTKGVAASGPPLPLTVAVAPFTDGTGDPRPAQDLYVFSASYLNALDDSRLFQGVYAEVEAPGSDLRIEGTVKEVDIYQSNLWFLTWVVLGIATFGLFPGLGALLGLPYGSDNGSIEIETRLIARETGAIVATYTTEWDDKVYLNIYNRDRAKDDFYMNPKLAVQAVMNDQMQKIAADREKIRAAVKPRAPGQSTMTGSEAPPGVPRGGGGEK